MMFRVYKRVWLAAAISWLAFIASGVDKKMIGHSWDLLNVRPADVVRNLDAWEQVPLDGISLSLSRNIPDVGSLGHGSVMQAPRWERQWFAEDIAVLRQCASRNLKHNFLTTFWAPRKRLAWDDDKGWEQFAHNLGVVAWLAKEGHAKGILIDPEDYPKTRQYFVVDGDAPYPVSAALARKRGAQVMASMAAEYPEITLLSFWMLSLHPNYLTADDPLAMTAAAGDLWPSFINGMLDALPPAARMIDGDEHAYRYQAAKNDFYLSCWRTQNRALKLVDPVNRVKYQTQVLAGFGLYLDMYTNASDSPWFFGELDGSRLNHLRYNFAQALDAAQEYVWIYGEKMDWIKWKGTHREKNPTWEERLPGFLTTLARLRDPRGWAEKMVEQKRQAGTLTNCIVNGGCVVEKSKTRDTFREKVLPKGWWSWQEETKRQGVFGTDTRKGRKDESSLSAVGVEQGCFGTSHKVSPGQEFVVEAYAQGVKPALTVAWKRAGSWDWSLAGTALRFTEPGKESWRHAFGVVRVPQGADELVVMLGVRQREDERTWFDDAGLYLITD